MRPVHGVRSVAALQEGVDPVGCCVGLRGIRIQNIVNELNGEKIDVVLFSADPSTFIANALSPAQILSVELDKKEGVATVVVPDRQLSLAIGKEGQNVRLAAKLTGWRIDIKSASAAEAERLEAEKVAEAQPEVKAKEEEELIAEAILASVPVAKEPESTAEAEAEEEAEAETLPSLDEEFVAPAVVLESPVVEEKPQIRFAEDIMARGPTKAQTKTKKKKKKKGYQDEGGDEEEGAAAKRARRVDYVPVDDDEEF